MKQSDYVNRKRREHARQFANGRPSWIRAEWDIRGCIKTPLRAAFRGCKPPTGTDYILAKMIAYAEVMGGRPGWRRVVTLPASLSERARWQALVIAARYDVDVDYVDVDA